MSYGMKSCICKRHNQHDQVVSTWKAFHFSRAKHMHEAFIWSCDV